MNSRTTINYFKITKSINFYRYDINFYPLETQAETSESGYTVPEGTDWSFPRSYKTSFNANDINLLWMNRHFIQLPLKKKEYLDK